MKDLYFVCFFSYCGVNIRFVYNFMSFFPIVTKSFVTKQLYYFSTIQIIYLLENNCQTNGFRFYRMGIKNI